jgi:long-chain acyl-CoA synthetase
MNCIDYFFEESGNKKENFLVGREETSFESLKSQSYKLANFLFKKVGTGKSIILLSANSAFFITAYMAIMKSGNICVPLDPKIEEENLNYIKEQSNPEYMFLTPDVERRLAVDWCEKMLPTELDESIANEIEMNTEPDFDKEQTAQIIFTSGSTGTPKGVMLSHKNLIANTSSIIEYLHLTSEDRIMVVMPFFYCYGLSLLHTHLRVGGSIVLNNSFIFLGAVINDLKNHKCTGFAGVPSHFQILLRKSDTFVKTEFSDLRYVTQAGGKLSTVFIDEFRAAHPNVKFIVMYGQTEATARLSYLPAELYEKKKGSLGKGIPGVELKVVNGSDEEVKPGEVGEIIAKGNNVMKGYINEPEETANTLKNGWLYTGDLATIDEEGYIYHSARKKEIIKVGGKRISPKEIEEVILGIHEVVDCTVEGFNDDILGEAIRAIVVVNNIKEISFTEQDIKEHCSKYLALYKIPQSIEIIEKMILSSSGKKIKGKL